MFPTHWLISLLAHHWAGDPAENQPNSQKMLSLSKRRVALTCHRVAASTTRYHDLTIDTVMSIPRLECSQSRITSPTPNTSGTNLGFWISPRSRPVDVGGIPPMWGSLRSWFGLANQPGSISKLGRLNTISCVHTRGRTCSQVLSFF